MVLGADLREHPQRRGVPAARRVFKLDGVSEFLASNNGLFFVCAVTVLLAGYLVSLGMEGYAKIQKVCFYIGMAALAASSW